MLLLVYKIETKAKAHLTVDILGLCLYGGDGRSDGGGDGIIIIIIIITTTIFIVLSS